MTDGPSPRARELNDTIRYTCWAVYRRAGAPGPAAAEQVEELEAKLATQDVVVRGWYDVSGMRADADLMVWLHAPDAPAVQGALRELRRTALGPAIAPHWSAMALHRPAEFNKGHIPAFLSGKPAQDWLCVYPFVRSYEWYLLPEEERRALLVEHGMMGREYPDVLSNTVASFALGDWEWILALESPVLHDLVDLMRHLRGSGARRHVREEVPFFTGQRLAAADAVDALR